MVKITHKSIHFSFVEDLFKKKHPLSQNLNPLWEGAYIIHSFIDNNTRILHLFFHDPINGMELTEGQDILTVPESITEFRRG